MFLGCSPCCSSCPSYGLDPFTTNPELISNLYLDISLRLSVSSFTDFSGYVVSAVDTGYIDASGLIYPVLSSPITTAFRDISLYDEQVNPQRRYTGLLDFRFSFGIYNHALGFVLRPFVQWYVPNQPQVPAGFFPQTFIQLFPCRVLDSSGLATPDPIYGDVDVVVEPLGPYSIGLLHSYGQPSFSLNAGSVSVDEPLQPLHQFSPNTTENVQLVHRFAGKAKRSEKLMDGVVPLSARWIYPDLEVQSIYGQSATATTEMELICRTALARFGDGAEENLMPWWTDSLATFSA